LNNPRLFLSAIALVAALSLSAAPDPTYTALRASRPDGRTVAVTNFAFDRDVYHLTLNGTLHLLAPVDGKEVGAVFTGDGIATLTPATPPERRQLAINSGDDKLTVLTEKFERAVFFDAALVKQVAATATRGAPAPDATKAFDDFSSVERRKLHDNVHIRVLQELLDPVTQPLFLAFIRGRNYGPAFLGVDPRGYDVAFSTSLLDGGEKTYLSNLDDTKGGLWYLAYMKSELDGGTATVLPRPALADRYLIDTTIAPNSEISGSTTIALTVRNATRVLPFALDGKLRIDDVSIAKAGDAPQFTPAAFIQEKPEEDDNSAVPRHRQTCARERRRWQLHRSRARQLVRERRPLQRAGDVRADVPLSAEEPADLDRQRDREQSGRRPARRSLEVAAPDARRRLQLRPFQEALE
jgi:hypothetical protein